MLWTIQTYAAPQKRVKKFDQESYEKATKGVDYLEDIEHKKQKERKPSNFDPPDLGDWSMVGDVLKGLIILSVVLILAYIVFRVFEANYVNRKVINYKDQHTIDNLEEHIHEVNLRSFLENVLKEGNYKLAVRIYYLILIKELSESNLIRWKKQKTNGEYLSEMFGDNLFESFRNNTVLFERIWYGDIEIDNNNYLQVEKKYESFVQAVRKRKVKVNE